MKALHDFHMKYGHNIYYKPSLVNPKTRDLRYRLVKEEAEELCDALKNNDLVDIADGIADLLYVTFGTALSYGIPIEEVFKEVHRSNMSKSLKKDEFGKTLKEGYSPARLEDIIIKYS